MSDESAMLADETRQLETTPQERENIFPENWKKAIAYLVSSRIKIVSAESKIVASGIIKKIILFAIAGLCLLLAWIVIVAGLVGLLTVQFSWPWPYVAFGIAGLHLLIALMAFLLTNLGSSQETFPVTKAEFKKDQEWLNQLKTQSK